MLRTLYLSSVFTLMFSAPLFATIDVHAQDLGEEVFSFVSDLPDVLAPTVSYVEVDVNQGIKFFEIGLLSIDPWICEAEIFSASADGRILPAHGNRFYVERNHNIEKLSVEIYIPKNEGYCAVSVIGFR